MTTDTEYDTFESGIGISTLASQRGPVEDLQESSPIAINGVALPESTVLLGGQGVRHFYPPAMARRAAEVLQQQLDDDDQTVHIVKNFHELEGRASADDIIGEVTSVGYSQGVGVIFAGEITDETTAEKIQLGYLDISPTVARALGEEMDPQMEARPVSDVGGFRDIAVVGQGQPGAGVEVGANPAIEALSRDALTDMDDGTPEPDADTESPEPDADDADDTPEDGDADTDADAEPEDDDGDTPADDTPEPMSLDDAKQTIAEEYDLDPDEVEARLTAEDSLQDGPEGTDAGGGSESDGTPDGTVILVEAGEDGDGGASESAT